MDRTVIYALVVGAILIVAFFALWRGTGNDIASPNAPTSTTTGTGSGTGSGTGTGTGGSSPGGDTSRTPPPPAPPAK